MSKNKLVVIGGNAAGMSAASKLRRLKKNYEIVVFEKGRHTSYASCGMPYYIAGKINSHSSLIARSPETFREKYNIDVRTENQVESINIKRKLVIVNDLANNKTFEEKYDKLLIASGSSPVVPQINGINSGGIFTFEAFRSGKEISEFITNNKPRKAVVVGGGYIGIEMAETLLNLNIDVSVIDMAPQLMVSMDREIAEIVSMQMQKDGAKVYTDESLKGFDVTSDGNVSVVITDKQKISADIVILGMGRKPNTKFVGEAGIELGVKNAVRVNQKLETNITDIWAAGDCAESYNLLTNSQNYIALGTVANKQGLVAGLNIAGQSEYIKGVLGTAITKFNNLEIARTGLSEKEAKSAGFEFVTAQIESTVVASYYDKKKMTVKLVAEKNTGRLLGAQIVGSLGAAKRIDVVATSIFSKLTAKDLMLMDLSYAPPFSPVWDPLQIAARKLV